MKSSKLKHTFEQSESCKNKSKDILHLLKIAKKC